MMRDKLEKFLEYWYARIRKGEVGRLGSMEYLVLQSFVDWCDMQAPDVPQESPLTLGVSVAETIATKDKPG